MNRVPDELLMAYADDALPDDQRCEVEAFLQADEVARAYVENLRRSAHALRQAYDAPMHESPPQRLIDAILQPSSNVMSIQSARKRTARKTLPVALAASLAALAVLVSVKTFDNVQPDRAVLTLTAGLLAPNSALSDVLETARSGDSRAIGDRSGGAIAQPMLTFFDRDDRPCREMEVHQAAAGSVDLLIACRGADAAWNVEGVYRLSASTDSARNETGFAPAAGAGNGAPDALLDRLGGGDPVSPQQEQRLLRSGWR